MQNIILIGLSGSGKTTFGNLLAQQLGRTFLDLDDLIAEQAGMEINDIFARYGEKHFRDLESDAVKQAARQQGAVIATGGGAVLRPENVDALRETGRIIFLDRPLDDIVKDIRCDARPLLKDGAEKLFRMSEQRRTAYLAAADEIFQDAGSVQEALPRLTELVLSERRAPEYLVIGDPIAHTLSPVIHNTVFASLGLPDRYAPRLVKRGEAGGFVRFARREGVRGFNITAPHKKDVIPYLDEVDAEAAQCGAVNTVVLRNGRLCGYNTDMQGLLLAVRGEGREYKDAKIVVLGTGGAAGGVALKAVREGAREVAVLGRHPESAAAVVNGLRVLPTAGTLTAGALSPEDFQKALPDADILVNCIPLGMSGVADDFESLEFLRLLPQHALVCDMIYSPPRTALMKAAESCGLRAVNGLPMLIYQSILADELYTGRALDASALYRAVSGVLKLG